MFISWLLGLNKKYFSSAQTKYYPIIFSIHEDEINMLLDWIREHDCPYIRKTHVKDLIKEYSNKKIIKDGLVSGTFEQYGYMGNNEEENISIILMPSIMGTRYKLRCRCGEEFEAIDNNIKNVVYG